MGDNLRYWLGFNLTPGIGPMRIQRLLDAFGDIRSAWTAPGRALRNAGLRGKEVESLLRTRASVDLDRAINQVSASGFQILCLEDESYPQRLREITYPPPVLYIWGELRSEDRWGVAVVGTRKPTAYGRAVTHDLSSSLALSGVCVISGLARGIDSIAHQSALQAGGRTIAVLGSGLDELYPPEHRQLAERIAQSGAVISDYPLGTRPEGKNFPPRNRIISGLSSVVVVVEAGQRSGALITADFANEQGRDVFAVPGSIRSRASKGTNALIQSGARLMLTTEEVLEALNMDVVARHEIVQGILPEDETERLVLDHLGGEPVHIDDLCQACSIPIASITSALAMLELKGYARQVGGMQYVRAHERGATYKVG